MTPSTRIQRLGRVAIAAAAFAFLAGIPSLVLAADAPRGPATFSKDVAPIFQQHCQICHHPGTSAPMSLVTYEDARPWARSLKTRVSQREMPPWHIDRSQGIQQYKNDRSLSDAEIATVVNWVDGGAPAGDPKEMPKPLQFRDESTWTIGKPDLIVNAPKHVVPA